MAERSDMEDDKATYVCSVCVNALAKSTRPAQLVVDYQEMGCGKPRL
jgi:hypothetical protein